MIRLSGYVMSPGGMIPGSSSVVYSSYNCKGQRCFVPEYVCSRKLGDVPVLLMAGDGRVSRLLLRERVICAHSFEACTPGLNRKHPICNACTVTTRPQECRLMK